MISLYKVINMINEETSNKTLHMEMQAAKVTAKGIQKLLKDLMQKLDQQKQSLDSCSANFTAINLCPRGDDGN